MILYFTSLSLETIGLDLGIATISTMSTGISVLAGLEVVDLRDDGHLETGGLDPSIGARQSSIIMITISAAKA